MSITVKKIKKSANVLQRMKGGKKKDALFASKNYKNAKNGFLYGRGGKSVILGHFSR